MGCVDVVLTGKKIEELRKKNGISVQMIADELCLCSRNAVYKWMKGECLPEVGNLISLAKMFGVTVEDIVVVSDV